MDILSILFLGAFAIAMIGGLWMWEIAEHYWVLDKWCDYAEPMWEQGMLPKCPMEVDIAESSICWTKRHLPLLDRVAYNFYVTLYRR